MTDNVLPNCIQLLSLAFAVLWVLMLLYKWLCIRTNHPYQKSGIYVKFKFSYCFLMSLDLGLLYAACIIWHEGHLSLAIATLIAALVTTAGWIMFLVSNHKLTVGAKHAELLSSYRTLRIVSAVLTSVFVAVLNALPYFL